MRRVLAIYLRAVAVTIDSVADEVTPPRIIRKKSPAQPVPKPHWYEQ